MSHGRESFEHLDATQAGVEMGRQLNGALRRYIERVVVPEMRRREAAGAGGDEAGALLTGLGVEAMKGGDMFVRIMDEHFGKGALDPSVLEEDLDHVGRSCQADVTENAPLERAPFKPDHPQDGRTIRRDFPYDGLSPVRSSVWPAAVIEFGPLTGYGNHYGGAEEGGISRDEILNARLIIN